MIVIDFFKMPYYGRKIENTHYLNDKKIKPTYF